jgi:hypothetical protein
MAKQRGVSKAKKSSVRKKSASAAASRAGTVYKDFERYSSSRRPKWHPVKMMRYVFFRMIGGCTITDALEEIHWNATEFWHLVDKKHQGPFAIEYRRAKMLQGRAFADQVVTIAEGRDVISRRAVHRLEKILAKALRKAGRQKSALAAKAIMESVLSSIDATDKTIIARNRLQMDAAKWIATTSNPQEFSQKSTVALGGTAAVSDDGTVADTRPLVIQFVGPDGKVVKL